MYDDKEIEIKLSYELIPDLYNNINIKNRVNYELFDFDCNLTHPDLIKDVDILIKTAKGKNINQLLVPGSTIKESIDSIELCKHYPNLLYPTVGIHPFNVKGSFPENVLNQMIQLIKDPLNKVVAIGECGLDNTPGFPLIEEQIKWFEPQIDLAIKLNIPLFLHERLAHTLFVSSIKKIIKKNSNKRFPSAIVHCFTGNEKELLKYIEMGFYIGITGFICKEKYSKELRKIVHHIPLDKLMVETDAPYLGFPNCRSDMGVLEKKQYPNVPSSLPYIIQTLSTCMGISVNEIAMQTTRNARKFLKLI